MTTTYLVLLTVLIALALITAVMLLATANRLDRLHIRTDAARAALEAALGRRAVVARAVAAGALNGSRAELLRDTADRAESAQRGEREAAENTLTGMLAELDRAGLPGSLAGELFDAEHRVVIARRVHNDAVRDTLGVRRMRTVRYFRLAGKARPPEYFEIVEPEP